MQYKERPCVAYDCNNWTNNPDICVKCVDESFEYEVERRNNVDELFILPSEEYNYTLEDIDIIQDGWVCTIREWLKFTSEEVLHSTLTDDEIDNMSHEELNELIEEFDWLQWS